MSSKYNITCQAFFPNDNKFTVSEDGTVWPCCYYAATHISASEPNQRNPISDDEDIVNLRKTDPDWNNLNKRPLEEIINHDYFVNRVSPVGWHGDNPPPLCIEYCHKKLDSV
tara:strand:- start:577 stop:912 length:336 start_codon:yes stop_codon:yes gene_type:complete